MKPPPRGWPRIASAVYYDNPAAAIDWLCNAFGFELRLKVEGEGGSIEYSELEFHGGLIMVSQAGKQTEGRADIPSKSPRALGGVTQAMCVCVDDADAHCARAKAAGATIDVPPATSDYGEEYWSDRSYRAVDLEGHHWWFMQRIREKAAP